LASAIASLASCSEKGARTIAQPRPKGQGSLTKLVPLDHVDDHPEVLHVHRGEGGSEHHHHRRKALPDVTHELVDAHRRAADRDPESTA
jgi:hypothetical protein